MPATLLRRLAPWMGASLLLSFVLAFVAVASARTEMPALQINARVTDLSGTLTSDQRDNLERELAEFERRKGSQIMVLMVGSVKPLTIEEYALRVADLVKPGRKRVDDGVVLLIAKDDRELRIDVRYGLEGAIPDAIAKRVISDVIVPFFKRGDYYGGIDAGINQLMRLIDGEPLPEPKRRDRSWNQFGNALPMAFIGVFVIGGMLRAVFGRLIGASIASSIAGVAAWLLFGLLLAIPAAIVAFVIVLATNGRSGGFGGGGWNSGSGGWGGGGGGGWSGGGGMGGGGGASGRW